MIPKVIHYCWFGGNELDELSKKCIDSWKKHCPDYEIIEWNENNYDYQKHPFMKAAYDLKKWAFVSDYARLDIVYNYGGIYLDTDVELLKCLDEFLSENCFLGIEEGSGYIATGLGFGAEKHNEAVRQMIDEYKDIDFEKNINNKAINCPVLNTKPFYKYGFKRGIKDILKTDVATIYPSEYFCPLSFYNDKLNISDLTVSVHHYSASWKSGKEKEIREKEQHIRNKYGESKKGKIIKAVSYRIIELKYALKEKRFGDALNIVFGFFFRKIAKLLCIIIRLFIVKVLNYQVIAFENKNDYEGNSFAIYNYIKDNSVGKYVFLWFVLEKGKSTLNEKNTFVFEHNEKSMIKSILLYSADYLFFDDIPIYKKRNNQICVYLTHGVPATKNVKGIINVPDFVDYSISTSKATEKMNRYLFSLSDDTRSVISGLPRTDVFASDNCELKKITNRQYRKIIIWLPTFRTSKYEGERKDSNKKYPFDIPAIESEDDYYKLDSDLKKNDYLLIIKLHPVQKCDNLSLKNTDNILIVSNDEMADKRINLNSLMAESDALISDYSSAAYDYFLLDRPIGYIVDDIDDYKLGFAYDNILELMPGEKLFCLDDMISFIESLSTGEDRFKEERNKVKQFMHDFDDFNNCERILTEIGFIK